MYETASFFPISHENMVQFESISPFHPTTSTSLFFYSIQMLVRNFAQIRCMFHCSALPLKIILSFSHNPGLGVWRMFWINAGLLNKTFCVWVSLALISLHWRRHYIPPFVSHLQKGFLRYRQPLLPISNYQGNYDPEIPTKKGPHDFSSNSFYPSFASSISQSTISMFSSISFQRALRNHLITQSFF